jgi:signal transduction histidine kinase
MLAKELAPPDEGACCSNRRTAGLVFVGNTLIALVLWLGGIGGPLSEVWLTSQCIGFCIMACEIAIARTRHTGKPPLWLSLLGVLVGATLGVGASYLLGFFPGLTAATDWPVLLRIGVLALIVGLIAHVFFYNVQRLNELTIAQQAAQLRELTREKDVATANLKLLQAQIEPHFLFNTLANLHSLIGANDTLARRLLERLNDYLRASLDRSRSAGGTLGDECRLLAAYLDIQALRMGERLAWSIDVPPELLPHPLPPMLLQPLVENAIRHGIEPRVGPGQIRVRARSDGQCLYLSVSDDGQGLAAAAQQPRTGRTGGVGLNNVRERLAAIYGAGAELVLRTNEAEGNQGVTAEICIPEH